MATTKIATLIIRVSICAACFQLLDLTITDTCQTHFIENKGAGQAVSLSFIQRYQGTDNLYEIDMTVSGACACLLLNSCIAQRSSYEQIY